MSRYSWGDYDQLEESVSSGRASAEIVAALGSGMSHYSMSARRDAALAELLASRTGALNLRSFDAKGDGVTDDSAAFQAAIAAAANGELLVPPGHYLCRSQLHITSPMAIRGVHGATIEFPAGVTTGVVATTGEALIDALDVVGLTITGLTIVARNKSVIGLRGCSRARITGNRVLMDGTTGATTTKCVLIERSPNETPIEDIEVSGNHFQMEGGEAVLVIGHPTAHPNRIVIATNDIDCGNVRSNSTSAIKVDRFCANWVIANNVIDGNGSADIASGITAEQGAGRGYIGGNVIGEMVERGIRVITDNSADPIGPQPIDFVLIDGNVVHTAGDGGSGDGTGIYLDGENAPCQGIVVSNNLVVGMRYGLRENVLDGVADLIVRSNTFLDCTQDQVVQIKSSGALVQGNYVKGSAAVRSFAIAHASTAGVRVRDNVFLQVNGSGSAGFTLGTGHIIERNVGLTNAVYEHTVPDADGTRNLGSDAIRWALGYVDSLHVTDGVTFGPAAAAASAGTVKFPNAATLRWRNAGDTADIGLWVDTADVLRTDAEIRSANYFRDGVTAGITASTTQTQGQAPLTSGVNQVSVVANANDTVTLPPAEAGRKVVIINDGANTLRIYPATGDAIEAGGVNNPATLTAAGRVTYRAYNSTTWVST